MISFIQAIIFTGNTGKGKKNEKLPGAEGKKTAASDNTVTEAENKERRSGDNASMASL